MLHAPEMGADKELKVSGSTYQSTLKHPCCYGESSPTYDIVQQKLTVNYLKGDVYLSISEPDPSQLVLCDCFHGRLTGYYDEIPQLYNLFGILVVVFAIIATPLSLLCFIPAMEYMKKVSYNIIIASKILCVSYLIFSGCPIVAMQKHDGCFNYTLSCFSLLSLCI